MNTARIIGRFALASLPSYKETAAKYPGDPAAPAKLEQKNQEWRKRRLGSVPMPPNNVPDADLKALVEWILARK